MISLYSGTPGSGKSLHVASNLYWWIRSGKPCIGNFDINLSHIKTRKEKRYLYLPNYKLTPSLLREYAEDYAREKGKLKEDSILLVLDECQLLFNARDWSQRGRNDWLQFFTLHRHLGYRIILIAQFDRMLDRQIRSLIEYEFIHRKVSNFGFGGKVISFFTGGHLFVSVKMWYPLHQKVGSEFFRAKRFYFRLYDTFVLFDRTDGQADGGRGSGAPAEGRVEVHAEENSNESAEAEEAASE
jgi:zona occludens toxin